MIHCGRYDGQPVALQDAQGRAIPVLSPRRSVPVVLEDKNGAENGRDTVERQRCPF